MDNGKAWRHLHNSSAKYRVHLPYFSDDGEMDEGKPRQHRGSLQQQDLPVNVTFTDSWYMNLHIPMTVQLGKVNFLTSGWTSADAQYFLWGF